MPRKHRSGFHTMSHFLCAALREGGVGCLHEEGEPADRCDFSLLALGGPFPLPCSNGKLPPIATKGPRQQYSLIVIFPLWVMLSSLR